MRSRLSCIKSSIYHRVSHCGKQEKIAVHLSRQTAIQYGQSLTGAEMKELFESLFACENHQYTPDGQMIVTMMKYEEIENKFK